MTPREIILGSVAGIDSRVLATAHDVTDHAIAALRDGGYVIVPAEPTDEMITAGLIPTAAWQNIEGSALTVNREKMRLRYQAMVAAATDKV